MIHYADLNKFLYFLQGPYVPPTTFFHNAKIKAFFLSNRQCIRATCGWFGKQNQTNLQACHFINSRPPIVKNYRTDLLNVPFRHGCDRMAQLFCVTVIPTFWEHFNPTVQSDVSNSDHSSLLLFAIGHVYSPGKARQPDRVKHTRTVSRFNASGCVGHRDEEKLSSLCRNWFTCPPACYRPRVIKLSGIKLKRFVNLQLFWNITN